jgi:hypothetical protein
MPTIKLVSNTPERGFGRVADYLSLAHRELRNMQCFTDQDTWYKWNQSVDID